MTTGDRILDESYPSAVQYIRDCIQGKVKAEALKLDAAKFNIVQVRGLPKQKIEQQYSGGMTVKWVGIDAGSGANT